MFRPLCQQVIDTLLIPYMRQSNKQQLELLGTFNQFYVWGPGHTFQFFYTKTSWEIIAGPDIRAVRGVPIYKLALWLWQSIFPSPVMQMGLG